MDPRALSSGPHGASSPSLPGLQRPPTLELSNTGNINTAGPDQSWSLLSSQTNKPTIISTYNERSAGPDFTGKNPHFVSNYSSLIFPPSPPWPGLIPLVSLRQAGVSRARGPKYPRFGLPRKATALPAHLGLTRSQPTRGREICQQFRGKIVNRNNGSVVAT